MPNKKVLVVGAGVIGLSSAILLHDAGYDVSIWAKELTADTTSSKAAAFWFPFLCEPREKVLVWSKATYDYLKQHALGDPDSGARYIMFTEYLREKSSDPWWLPAVEVFERPRPTELPNGYPDGYRIKAIVMDTTQYLPWLLKQLADRSVSITQKTLDNFDRAFEEFNVVINCTGLGSKELCGDDQLYPVRGQVVSVAPNGFDKVVADDSAENLTYIIPRTNDIILGGTAQENDWNLEVDPQDTADILKKVGGLAPEFKNAEVATEKVGLRPARNEVRLEAEKVGDKTVIHNYGHGGSGFTIAWGCAQEVVSLVKAEEKQ